MLFILRRLRNTFSHLPVFMSVIALSAGLAFCDAEKRTYTRNDAGIIEQSGGKEDIETETKQTEEARTETPAVLKEQKEKIEEKITTIQLKKIEAPSTSTMQKPQTEKAVTTSPVKPTIPAAAKTTGSEKQIMKDIPAPEQSARDYY